MVNEQGNGGELFNTLLQRSSMAQGSPSFGGMGKSIPSIANGLWSRPPQQGAPPQAPPQGPPPMVPTPMGAAPIPPASPPPNPQNKVPPAVDRWKTANAMGQAYANNWQPNPMLLQALMHWKK